MKKVNYLFSLILLFGLLLYGCNQGGNSNNSGDNTKKDTSKTTQEDKKESNPKPIDPQYGHLARFIAGLPAESGSPYAKYESEAGWKNFASSSDNQWSFINNKKVPVMKEWANQELKKINEKKGLLFYPFSGPDFLHAAVFFPEVDEIVMIGLEPIGNLPNMDEIAKKSLGGYFGVLQQSLYSILNLSFFQTNHMAVELTGKNNPTVDGTLPVLFLFIERTGHKVLHYEKIAISPEGKIISADKVQNKGTDSTYYGTKIAFRRNDKPNEYKVLYYFAVNLQDTPYTATSGLTAGGLNERKDLLNYLESLKINVTYLKSASYLMYRDTFSRIRNIILGQSEYLLQDDSGMPINFIAKDKWKTTFYGTYTSPIPLFSVRYQPDLRVVYQKGGANVKPLPFGIGYQYAPGTSNLMLAEKIK
ncbi:MAG: hypothetical protein EAZ55_06910 [Cytophagales bacterium]|nr:MAG: hypothetical protein EAZ55_06910 [Cytophagales bacterium]